MSYENHNSKKVIRVKMVVISSALALLASMSCAQGKELLIGFEKQTGVWGFSGDNWRAHGINKIRFVQGEPRAGVDSTQAYSGKASLKVEYPKGAVGPSKGGYQAAVLLAPRAEYYFSYWLKFSKNFSWGGAHQGGKLPGLASGALCSGGDSCTGDNGFTARYMWRKNGAAVLYLYHMNKPHKWGEDFPLTAKGKPVIFPRDKWVHLRQRVKINTGAQANGEVQVWVNGEEVLNLTQLAFVANGTLIDTLYFSTFHGGNTPEWAPTVNSAIWFDDLLVTEAR